MGEGILTAKSGLWGRRLLVAVALSGGIACAGAKAHRRGTTALQEEKLDRAVVELRRATRERPKDLRFRADLRKAEMRAGQVHMDKGQELLDRREYEAAILEFQLALAADPFAEERATERIMRTQRKRDAHLALQDAEANEKAGDLSGAFRAARRAVSLDPQDPASREMAARLQPVAEGPLEGLDVPQKPVTLKFTGSRLREALEVFSQMTGVNFILDEAVKDEPTTLFIQDAPFDVALKLLLTRHQLALKVLDAKSVLIHPDTPEKRKQYRELQVETFYLTNLKATTALNLLRGVLDMKGGFVNEELNTLVLRDTPEALSVARQVLAANDMERAEVLLEIEMLEIDRGKLLKLGVDLTPDQAGASVAAEAGNAGAALTLDALINRFSARNVLVTLPSVVVNLRREDTEARILANPRIRVVDGQQAVIHIGERVPFVTVTSLNQVVSENIQFQDVGIKLMATPEVHRGDDLTLKLGLEVSSLGPSTTTASGNTVFRIGTRNASSVLRLRDGETQILGGLIQDEERTTVARIPFFGDIPVLGVLFSSHDRSRVTTDILLSITPRLIRSAPSLGPAQARVWAGRENDVRPSRAAAREEGSAVASGLVAAAPQKSVYELSGPTRVGANAAIELLLTGASAAAAEVELRYEPSEMTFIGLEAAGKPVEAVSDSTLGSVRWNAPASAFPIKARFRPAASGAHRIEFLVRPASVPGAPQPPAETRGHTTVLVDPG